MKFTLIALFAAATAVLAQDTVQPTRSGVCEPHEDHWHCPSGVPKPTYPPTAIPASSASGSVSVTGTPAPQSSSAAPDDHSHAVSATTCEPHGDHWHCPSGVPKPTTPPAQSSGSSAKPTTSRAANGTTSAASPSASSFPGAGVKVSGFSGAVLAVAGAVGAWVL